MDELLALSIKSPNKALVLARQDPKQFKPEEIQLLNYVEHIRHYKRADAYPDPGPISVSTVSSIGMISESRVLDLKKLNEKLMHGIGNKNYFIESIGPNKRKKGGSEFGNSINVKLRGTPNGKVTNIILSQNGRMTLTGGDSQDYGLVCMERLVEEIKMYPETFYNVNPETMAIENYETTMINTDYSLGFEVDQLALYEILIGEYSYFVTNNPEIYPGVSLHYMWHDTKKDGICNCTPNCLSRKTHSKNGSGYGENSCREITCAIFHSGNVIISGSNCMEQVHDVYKKINSLLKTHFEEIVDFSIRNFPSDHIVESG